VKITAAWRRTIEGIIEVGDLLLQAKEDLDHGLFEAMVRDRLPFGASAARRLMAIARHPVLTNRAHVHVLPASWGTLAQLARLQPERLEAAIGHGDVHPAMERRHATALLPKRSKRKRQVKRFTGDPDSGDEAEVKRRAYWQPGEARRLAGDLLNVVNPDDVDKMLLVEIREVADAWAGVLRQLERKRCPSPA
jgi:hypothetical protein